MKKILFPILAMLLCFTACDETEPVIPCLSCDTTTEPVEPTDKKVLIEEFTGVRCVNCPAGSAEIENLLDFYGAQLIAVSIHAGFFSSPYADSNEDYTIEEGSALENYLDTPLGYPTAVINRKLFNSEDDLQLSLASWAGRINDEIGNLSPFIFDLSASFDPTTRQLTVTNNIQVTTSIEGDVRYSIMLTESNITDFQLAPEGLLDNYNHKHVLRDMMTPFDGEAVTETLSANTTFTKENTMTLPGNWKWEDMSVVAFISRTGSSKEVLQVDEVKLID